MNEDSFQGTISLLKQKLTGEGVTFEDTVKAAKAATATDIDDHPWALDLIAQAERMGIPPNVAIDGVKVALTTSMVAPEVMRSLTTDRAAEWADEDPLLAASKAMVFALGGVIAGVAGVASESPLAGTALWSALHMLISPSLGLAAMLAQQAHERKTGG